MIKRIALAGAAGATVFTVALASASALSVDPGVAQSGTAQLTGDPDGVTVESYKFESDNNSSYGARIGGVDSSLAGSTMWVQIYDESGKRLARADKVIGEGPGDVDVSVSWKPVPFEDIDSVTITVE